jgi:hypothetical protein
LKDVNTFLCHYVPCAGIVQEFTEYLLTTEFSGGANWSSLDLPSDPGARQEIEALTSEGTKPELGHAGRGRGAASVGWLDVDDFANHLGSFRPPFSALFSRPSRR